MNLPRSAAIAGLVFGVLLQGLGLGRESLGPSNRRSALVISEIMYHPLARADGLDGEFIELHNSQPWAEDLSGYRLSGAVDFDFPADTVIPGGGFLVVAKSPAAAEAIYGIRNSLGPYDGQLSNDRETVRLRNPSGAVLLEIPYQDRGAWPLAADGLGSSLVLTEPSRGESNPAAWSASETAHGSPGGPDDAEPIPPAAVVINEVRGHPTQTGTGFVELLNRSDRPVEVGGMGLSVNRAASHLIAANTILAPGERLVIPEQSPGLALDGPPFLLALFDRERTRVLDAIRYAPHDPGSSSGRFPDGSGKWAPLATASPGAKNGPPIRPEVVFNEILFHPISELAADEFIELYNRSDHAIDVSGWRIEGGIHYTIPDGTSISPAGYLVIAKDVTALRINHPQLNSANSKGNYDGNLSNRGESLELVRPAEWRSPHDPVTVPHLLVDRIHYLDSSRWSRWADGGGSSLELIDPDSDNDLAANWADSEESGKSQWTTVEARPNLTTVPGMTPRSLQILLLAEGDMLVDEVELFNPRSRTRVQNGDFEATSAWVFQGNHEKSDYHESGGNGNESRALLVSASGRGDPHSNRIRQTLLTGLTAPGPATLRARVRWLRGHPEILFRLQGNFMEVVGRAQLPPNPGTPGMRNSRWIENAPPAIREVSHSPVLPAASETVTVTAQVSDPDGVGQVLLKYRVDLNEGATGEIPMNDEGQAPDQCADDGIYSAVLPGQPSGRLVAFHIVAADQTPGTPGRATFPVMVPEQECLVRFGDLGAPPDFGQYRLWFTRDTLNRWTDSSRPKASNEPLDVTFVYNGERALYNVGATYSGSFFNSPDYNGPTGRPCDYACKFFEDERFLGASRIILSWPGLTGTPDNTAQHEQFSYWLASRLGLPFNYRRYVSVIVNGVRRGVLMEDTQRPNSEFLQQWFPGESDGELFKTQIRYESNDSATDLILAGTEEATLQPTTNPDGTLRTASYRWNWAPQALGNSINSFDPIFQLVETLDLQDATAYSDEVRSLLDIEQWMRTFALEHIVGNWDSYGYGNGQNMYAYKPREGRWQLLMWDLDIGSGSSLGDGPTTSLFSLSNRFFAVDGDPEIVGRMYQHPEFVRAYWRILEEAVDGPMTAEQVAGLVDAKFVALRASFGSSIQPPDAIKSYLRQRRNYIMQQLAINASASFEIVSPRTPISSTDSSPLIIRGRAPVAVQSLRVNGVPVRPVWTDVTDWELLIPLFEPENDFRIEGFDRHGRAVDLASATFSVEFTGPVDPGTPNLVINEWMAANQTTLADRADGRFEDWLELHNAGTETVDLAGYTLTDDLDLPARWTFPAGTSIAPGGHLLIWLDGDLDQQDPATGQWHASFSLDLNGESIGLFSPDGVRVDAVEFGPQEPDLSMGRSPDGARTPPVCLALATPGAPNRAECPFRILEFTHPEPDRVRLTWRSTPRALYVVERSETLEPGSWSAASEPITALGFRTATEIALNPLQPATFFRVRIATP